jgi:uncharacterized protein
MFIMLTILLRLVLLGILVYILYRLLWKGEGFSFFKSFKKFRPNRKANHRQRRDHPQAPLEEMKKDPVCGTYIPENQAIKYKYSGETLYFCSDECKQKFQRLQNK